MKRIIAETENWLLIIPLLIWLVEKTITGTSTLDFHWHDTYFVFANISEGLVFLVLSLLPFACHVLLRYKIKGNVKWLRWHVWLSCSIIVVLFFAGKFQSYDGLAGLPRRYYDYKHWTDYHLHAAAVCLVLLLLVYCLLQCWLFLYTIIRLLRK